MQRDIGNEVVVAIIVVGVLAFALTFGIILSLSNTGQSGAGVAQVVTATDADTATSRPSATETDVATVTATRTPTATSSPTVATATQTRTQTHTPAPSSTPVPTNTPTRTVTATIAASATPAATATPTATATRQATASRTPTITASPTPSPSRTPTATVTNTAAPSATPTLTRTPTATASPSQTPTVTLTATATRTTTPSRTPTPRICIAPFGWVLYTARAGDTLLSIAQATGATTNDLMVANCLEAGAAIQSGAQIYVPRLPAPTPPAGLSGMVAQGCTHPGTTITSPVPGQHINRIFTIQGTASAQNFAYYRIEIRTDAAQDYNFYARSQAQVINGELGTLDLRSFSPGLYWIRVSVIDGSGQNSVTPCAIPVILE